MLRNLLATTVTPTSPLPSCVQEHSLPDPRPTSLKHKATDRIRITIPGPIFTAAPLSLRSGQGQNDLLGHSLLLAWKELYIGHPLLWAECQPRGESYP